MKDLLKRSGIHFPTTIVMLMATIVLDNAIGQAQTKYPKPPDQYNVEFRYRIRTERNERIRQYEAMSKFVGKLGFKETPYEDMDLAIFDPNAERMSGTIPGNVGRRLLEDERIQTVLLIPAGFKVPEDTNSPVKVLIQLNQGFTLEKQRIFSLQVVEVLLKFGFKETLVYDHRGYTYLRGSVPYAKLRDLLKDLRTQPAGWFLPNVIEQNLPEPYKQLLPIRLIEVLSEEGAPEPVKVQDPLPPIPADFPQVRKLSAEIRRIIAKDETKVLPLRVELVFATDPDTTGEPWRDNIRRAAPGAAVEGHLGNILTVLVPQAELAVPLASLTNLLSIRQPRSVILPVNPVKEDPKAVDPKKEARYRNLALMQVRAIEEPMMPNVLQLTRLDRLHNNGRRGTGVRVAVIDTDFTGWQSYVGKELPRTTQYVDMTPERNSEMLPEPTNSAANTIGHGTQCALAVRLAAPDADIVLVRLAADAPYQLATVLQYILDEPIQPESFHFRRTELEATTELLRGERLIIAAKYKKAFDNFDDDEKSIQARRDAKTAVAEIEARENLLAQKASRFLKLEADLLKLRGANVVFNALGWNSGLALESNSALSRFLDDRLLRGRPPEIRRQSKIPKLPLWIQPAGDTRGQSWVGAFNDIDSNGVMEFVPPNTPLPKDRWTPELGYLAFRPHQGDPVAELPANAKVRITIQWREPQDPQIHESEYRRPNVGMNLLLLRQRDPSGEKLATDEFELIARSESDPERLAKAPSYGIYEQTIETILPAGGRHAIRVEGFVPNSTRPGGIAGLPVLESQIEIRPRVIVEVLDTPTQSQGRIIFSDIDTVFGGVAVPAEARSVIAVGALHSSKRPEAASSLGAGPNAELLLKPDVLTYDQLPKLGDGTGPAKGTPLAAAFAAGTSASLISGGAPTTGLLRSLRIEPGYIFEVPEGILKR